MFERHNAIMLLIDVKTGLILDANPSAINFYGYEKAELCSMKIDDINMLSPEQVLLERTNAVKEERNHFIFPHKLANGEIRTVEVHSSPIEYKGERILFSILYDITDRKKAEQARLDSEKQQKEINITKDKLFSIISHDLRSPFNSILGLSELLSLNTANKNIEEVENIAKMIHTSSKSTLVLLDNLLDWARSQTGQIKFEPVTLKLKPIVLEIFEILSTTAKSKDISLNYNQSINLKVYAEENMLKTILRNLISNAIKFTGTNGKINIEAVGKHNFVEITVSDNGIGIKEDIKNRLFKVGENVTTTGTVDEKGSGLGLIICEEFVVRHGGRIWIESEVGKGSSFKFTLPFPKKD